MAKKSECTPQLSRPPKELAEAFEKKCGKGNRNYTVIKLMRAYVKGDIDFDKKK